MANEVTQRFSKTKLLSKIVAVIMVISLLMMFVGCKKQNAVNPTNNNSLNSTTSSDDDSEKTVYGEFTFEETVSNVNENMEIVSKGNTANLSKNIKGYADDKANNLRNEILNTGNTDKYYKIKGKKYYISSLNGDDLNDGTSPQTAFKSIEGLTNVQLKQGDAVLFERGSVIRLFSTFLASDGVTYGSYGSGEKPKIFGSAINLVNVEWTPSAKRNVWQIDYIYPECAGMFFDHGKEIGYKRTSIRNLKKNTDFFQDPSKDILYVYCDKGNPSKVYESIEFSSQMSIIGIPSGVDNVTIDNLCIKYGGIMGVSGTWNTDHVNVTNCEIGYIGGGTTSSGTVRYGNAIQFWTGANEIVCNHNWIYQTWDTAVTWQGNGGGSFTYNNISFCDNLLEYNNGDFEYWDDGSSTKNFVIEHNIMRFTSLGWGTRENDGGYRGIEGAFSGRISKMTVINHRIKDNIIDCPGRQIINLEVSPKDLGKGIIISGNQIYVNSKYRTTDSIIRKFKTNDNDENSVDAKNERAFVAALKKFDSSAVLKWY